jgi:hypothetical protein
MVIHSTKGLVNQEVDEKKLNWLALLCRSIAARQVRFLKAAMDNIQAIQESACLPRKSQESLDAMHEADRNHYYNLRKYHRQRFLTAQSHFQVNLRMFSLTTEMLMSLISLFNTPCRLRAT